MSAGRDWRLTLWRPAKAKQPIDVQMLDSELSVVRWSPDGKRLAAGNEHGVHVWTTGRFEPSRILRGSQGSVIALAFSDGGEWLYAAGEAAERGEGQDRFHGPRVVRKLRAVITHPLVTLSQRCPIFYS